MPRGALVPFVAVVPVVAGFVQGGDKMVIKVGRRARTMFIVQLGGDLSGVEPKWRGVGGEPIMDM